MLSGVVELQHESVPFHDLSQVIVSRFLGEQTAIGGIDSVHEVLDLGGGHLGIGHYEPGQEHKLQQQILVPVCTSMLHVAWGLHLGGVSTDSISPVSPVV